MSPVPGPRDWNPTDSLLGTSLNIAEHIVKQCKVPNRNNASLHVCLFILFHPFQSHMCRQNTVCGIWFMDVYGHPSHANPVGCGLMPIPNFWPWHVWADPCGNELLQKPVLHSACIQHRLCLQASGSWALKTNVCYRLLHWAQLDNLLGAGNQEIVFINFHSRTHCKWIQII